MLKQDTRGYFGIILHMPKTRLNVASTLRSAYGFGAAFVGHTGDRYHRCAPDTASAYRHVPLFRAPGPDFAELIPFDCIPVAVDIVPDACPLPSFVHPERAVYVFGPEDGTLGAARIKACERRIYIPTRQCLNLAVSVATVMYDRQAKRGLALGISETRGQTAAIPNAA